VASDDTLVIPAIVDFNTATYSLHKGLGDGIDILDGNGRTVRLQIVGMLKNSIFQGDLLVGEATFLSLFPTVNGYRYFLVDTEQQPVAEVQKTLEESLGDFGFDAETSHGKLAAFFAVQNTYLSTFQSLGGLGLLLGTFGLATVQLRSVLERRGELALMRASGFRRGRLVRMVMWENMVLLIGGLAMGAIAAGVALAPQWGPQAAGVPWRTLAGLLGAIGEAGLLAGWLATRSALRAAIVPALRGE
jgi:ABC-type antimicrobial peptide transport system permease subunit